MKDATRRAALPALICLLIAAAIPPAADAGRTLLSEAALETAHCAHCIDVNAAMPPPEGQIEGPCGLAISPTGRVYLADYYHRVVDVFGPPSAGARGTYLSQIALPGTNPSFGVNTLDSVCGLAFDAAGTLYGNEWHQSAVRLSGAEATIDDGESTGIAIDPSTNRLYVDDRARVAEYALPFTPGDEPLATFGLGSLEDAYGLAAAAGRVYVADASDQTVEVFEPAGGATPVATISGPFHALTDAALAVDPTNGHLLVVDNLQPGFEHPQASVLEFDSPANGYAFLGRLPGAPIHGGPSGIAIGAGGQVIVTDGNGELSNAFLYSPFEGSAFSGSSAGSSLSGPALAPSVGVAPSGGAGPSASASEVTQSGGIRAGFQGRLSPNRLPRRGRAPVHASVGVKIIPVAGRKPPRLKKIQIAINRNGRFSPAAMPICRMSDIQPATTTAALAACRRSLVGRGTFSARVLLPEQAPFPSTGKVYAFNARWHGRPAILAHVYGTEPLPVSYTLPFQLVPQRGTFGTLLRASLPGVTGDAAYITSIGLTLGRGRYLTAGCPAPTGFSGASFAFARAELAFAGGRKLGQVLTRSCRVR
jgi:DNA-binding beta-propeller fold protein YncE